MWFLLVSVGFCWFLLVSVGFFYIKMWIYQTCNKKIQLFVASVPILVGFSWFNPRFRWRLAVEPKSGDPPVMKNANCELENHHV